MSDERAKTDDTGASTGSATDPAPTAGGLAPAGEDLSLAPAPGALPTGERVDEDGLPLDRPATLDDVRSNAGSGRVIAVGCTFLVIAVLGLFWLIRGGLLR